MYLKKSTYKDGRTVLSIVEGIYDPATKNSRTHTVKRLGYLDALKKEYDDPIAHFTEIARRMTAEQKAENHSADIPVNLKERIPTGTDSIRNLGYLAASRIYHELEIDQFFANRQRRTKVEYNLNAVFRALVFARLIFPGSKKYSFENFYNFDQALEDAIAQKNVATQKQKTQAIEIQTEKERAAADKEIAILNAERDAAVKLKEAEANAEAIRVKADAEAEANKKIAQSVTPELVEYPEIEKWNGSKATVITGGSVITDVTAGE